MVEIFFNHDLKAPLRLTRSCHADIPDLPWVVTHNRMRSENQQTVEAIRGLVTSEVASDDT